MTLFGLTTEGEATGATRELGDSANLKSVVDFLFLYAKQIQERGEDWQRGRSQAFKFLLDKGYTKSEIDQCIDGIPFDPSKRIELLKSCWGKDGWYEWAVTWASQQEIQAVQRAIANTTNNNDTPLSSLLSPISSSPGGLSPGTSGTSSGAPLLPEQHQNPHPVYSDFGWKNSQSINASPMVSPMVEAGYLIEEGFKAFGLSVSFLPEESSDAGLRCFRLVFVKPLEMLFSTPQKYIREVLSNAGFDPDWENGRGVSIKGLPKNRFEMHVPKPPELWKEPHLFSFLLADKTAIGILKDKKGSPEDRLLRLCGHLRKTHKIEVSGEPRVPVAVNLDGKLVWLCLSSHVFVGGSSGSGKSTFLKTIVHGLKLLYPPELVQFVYIDLKDGATLSRFCDMWNWERLKTCTEPKFVSSYWETLHEEVGRRSQTIIQHGCENILEYNSRFPSSPMPWIFVIFDEVGSYKKSIGAKADEWLQLCMSKWRAWGVVVIASTQYPSQGYALGPDTRENFQIRVLFACGESCATLVFGKNDPDAGDATRLMPRGDCLIKEKGRKCVRGHALYLPKEFEDRMVMTYANLCDTNAQSMPQPQSNSLSEK